MSRRITRSAHMIALEGKTATYCRELERENAILKEQVETLKRRLTALARQQELSNDTKIPLVTIH